MAQKPSIHNAWSQAYTQWPVQIQKPACKNSTVYKTLTV